MALILPVDAESFLSLIRKMEEGIGDEACDTECCHAADKVIQIVMNAMKEY